MTPLWLGVLLLAAPGPPPANTTLVEEARVRSTVEDILAGAEYRRLRGRREAVLPSPSPRAEPGASSGPAPSSGRAAEPSELRPRSSSGDFAPLLSAGVVQVLQIFVYALLAVAVVGLVVLVLRNRRAWTPDAEVGALTVGPDPSGTGPPPGDRTPNDYLTQALTQARAGRHREAIRLLLVGAMSSIERRGLIQHRQGLTNRDYLRSVRREPALRRSLEPLVSTFDEVHFGRREASAARFDDCRRHFESAFRER